ncbi:hypothetical protein ABZ619_40710 [Streptomyces sp. NPDC007851]|uniref:hypothetical protein n=1 Tax=Streptomyces sp. NPDC007851 TaxID=3155008 RepID=UPI0033E2E398
MTDRQEQTAPDAVLTRIGQIVMLHHAGDREEARGRLLDLWAEIGEHGDPLHRCTLAHYLADTQDDPADELAWDLRALSAADEADEARGASGACGTEAAGRAGAAGAAREADGVGEGRGAEERGGGEKGGPLSGVRGFYPSLHLNLAADYVKLGRTEAARTHLRRARGAATALGDDGYGNGVRAAISRLALRLGEEGDDGPDGERWGPPRQRPS